MSDSRNSDAFFQRKYLLQIYIFLDLQQNARFISSYRKKKSRQTSFMPLQCICHLLQLLKHADECCLYPEKQGASFPHSHVQLPCIGYFLPSYHMDAKNSLWTSIHIFLKWALVLLSEAMI